MWPTARGPPRKPLVPSPDGHISRRGTQLRQPAQRRARPPRSRRAGYAADTASSGRPRCRSGAPPGAPGEGLPDTAPPRRSLRPRRRSPDSSSAPAPPRFRRPEPDTGGALAAHSAYRTAGRDGRRDPCGRFLAKGAALPASRAALGRQLLFQVLVLAPQALVLTRAGVSVELIGASGRGSGDAGWQMTAPGFDAPRGGIVSTGRCGGSTRRSRHRARRCHRRLRGRAGSGLAGPAAPCGQAAGRARACASI